MFRPSKNPNWIGKCLDWGFAIKDFCKFHNGHNFHQWHHEFVTWSSLNWRWPPGTRVATNQNRGRKKNIYIYTHQTIIKGQPLKQKQTTNHEFLQNLLPRFFCFALWSAIFFVSTNFWMVFYAYFQGEMIRFDWSFSNGFCKWLFGFLKIWIFRIFFPGWIMYIDNFYFTPKRLGQFNVQFDSMSMFLREASRGFEHVSFCFFKMKCSSIDMVDITC